MYNALLTAHSYLRYIILVLLIVVIVASCIGLIGRKAYSNADDKLNLFLFISTHLQLLLGLILYFVSPAVVFSGEAMKDPSARYWLVEHNTAMIIAVVFITLARTTARKMADAQSRHRRMLVFNLIALFIIVATIGLSGRGFINFR